MEIFCISLIAFTFIWSNFCSNDFFLLRINNKYKKGLKKKYNFKSILGKDAEYNSKKIVEIFNGKHNAFLEIVALNAAAGLVISEKESNLKKAYYKTKSYLLSGNAIEKINQLIK